LNQLFRNLLVSGVSFVELFGNEFSVIDFNFFGRWSRRRI